MRLWSLHPKYLDPKGLVALWREALLAQKVLLGETRGYRSHPQLIRFNAQRHPLVAAGAYLKAVHTESVARGYAFDRTKINGRRTHLPIPVTSGQVEYEWERLMAKLAVRSPLLREQWRHLQTPETHPLFQVVRGGIEPWERDNASGKAAASCKPGPH